MATANDYTLRLSDTELNRYRMMAAAARVAETAAWQAAGIDKGARIVDIGCGPGLPLLELVDGFDVVHRQARFDPFPLAREVRPPSWAGRQAMLDAGACTEADIARWDAALTERPGEGLIFVSQFTLVARRPA